ncbi:MAG: LAGLIDADG family homing endonuclease [Candidatus Pacearchaeota archaeon]
MANKIYLPDLYVETDKVILSRVKGSINLTSRDKNKNMINLNKINISKNQMWNFLDGMKLRGRSGKILSFQKETTPKIAKLLGFIITDGSLLSTEGRVKLCQKDIGLIHDYLDIINREYETNLTFSFDGKEANISSVPLRYILNKYYKIPLGKKVRIVEVPLQIMVSEDKEILKSFVAGLFDGDGYIQYYYLKNKPILDHANFCISTSSNKLIKQTKQLLGRLGINCSISRRSDTGRLSLQTAGFMNSWEFYKQIVPLLSHKKRRYSANKIFLGEDFLGKLTIPLNQELKNLFREIRIKKLDEELLNIKARYKYIKSLRSVESWTYPSNKGKIRSVYVYRALKLLNKNPKGYIPREQLNLMENNHNGIKS